MGPQDEKKPSALTTPPPSALSTEMLGMLAQDSNAGLENVRPEDLVIPFITILQKTSPQVDDANGAFLEGAKVGQFFESGTLATYDELNVIPCDYKTLIVEWHPRETGGGFVGQHELGYEQQFQRNDRGQWVTDQGTLLIQTMYFFCLLLQPDGGSMPVVFSFTSSQLKKGKTWVTRLTGKKLVDPKGNKFIPPMYEMIWKVTSVPEQNDKGNWRGYKIDSLKSVDTVEMFQAARKARAMFKSTAVSRPVESPVGGEN